MVFTLLDVKSALAPSSLYFAFGLASLLSMTSCTHWNETRASEAHIAKPGSNTTISTDVAIKIHPAREMNRLLEEADADRDNRITVDDLHHRRSRLTTSTFWLRGRTPNGTDQRSHYEISGLYYLSNLLQELKLAIDRKSNSIHGSRVFERPVDRISRSIRELFWDGLTRRIDARHLALVLIDPKIPKSEWRHLYVPHGDPVAYDYFTAAAKRNPELKVKVWRMPKVIDVDFMRSIRARHGLLALGLQKTSDENLEGVPFVVPGGRFNEMYGWDSYFEALGLLEDGRIDLARAMVDNFVYEIEHYGKILNANRSYYLNRSQPPFLTSMADAVYQRMDKTNQARANQAREWLARALRAAIKEYHTVWLSPERLTETGLSRYYGNGRVGIPPEVEKGHFDVVLKPAAKRHGLSVAELERRYNSGDLEDAKLDEFFAHDRAVRESGHDTTYRWFVNGEEKAADFVTVDLNSLIYKYEIDLARLLQTEFGGQLALMDGSVSKAQDWRSRFQIRKALIRRYLWDEQRKMFFDYNVKTRARSDYVSATSFYPLWSLTPSDPATRILNEDDAFAMVTGLLEELEQPGGLSSTSRISLAKAAGGVKHARQWEYPNGWAPHQMIAWVGLRNYGRTTDQQRLVYKWLYTITRNAADYNGTVPEKFDVVKRSHAVFAEYGNVGTEFSYITQEGFGWMNASYQLGLRYLPERHRADLNDLKPPEWLFPKELTSRFERGATPPTAVTKTSDRDPAL